MYCNHNDLYYCSALLAYVFSNTYKQSCKVVKGVETMPETICRVSH